MYNNYVQILLHDLASGLQPAAPGNDLPLPLIQSQDPDKA